MKVFQNIHDENIHQQEKYYFNKLVLLFFLIKLLTHQFKYYSLSLNIRNKHRTKNINKITNYKIRPRSFF